MHGLNLIGHERGDGLAKKPGCIRDGGNSGFQALSLALHFGVDEAILLGFDMKPDGRRLHWHSDHGGKLHNPPPRQLPEWAKRFASIAKATSTPILNATRETAIACFPRVELEEALR